VYVARLDMMKNEFKILVRKPEEKRRFERLAYCMVMCKCILKQRARGFVRDSSGSGQRPMAIFCEHGNILLGYIYIYISQKT
jgi:hypothetical protein